MATTPLAQRLYDKAKADASAFRAELVDWHLQRVDESNRYAEVMPRLDALREARLGPLAT